MQTDLHWWGDCYDVAPYGVNPQIFLDADPEPFRNMTGLREPVLQAGRIEPAKPSDAVLGIARNQLADCVDRFRSTLPSYTELCKSISGERLQIIEHLPQEMLASAYAASGVHCLVSWMDTCGLVSLEASLSGTALVGSTFGHELEYLENDAWLADPADPISIRRAVEQAWGNGRHNGPSLKMKRKSLERFNWENTVDKTEAMYETVLS